MGGGGEWWGPSQTILVQGAMAVTHLNTGVSGGPST